MSKAGIIELYHYPNGNNQTPEFTINGNSPALSYDGGGRLVMAYCDNNNTRFSYRFKPNGSWAAPQIFDDIIQTSISATNDTVLIVGKDITTNKIIILQGVWSGEIISFLHLQ